MTALAVVFHSGYGHTAKAAEAVAAGVKNVERCYRRRVTD
jgi:NAD(P)H dehydrogenase (quinone)